MSKQFKLISPKDNTVTLVKLNAAQGGGTLALNSGNKKINAKGSPYDGLAKASQDDLRRVFDNSPAYAKLIAPPDGHLAPWQTLNDDASEEE